MNHLVLDQDVIVNIFPTTMMGPYNTGNLINAWERYCKLEPLEIALMAKDRGSTTPEERLIITALMNSSREAAWSVVLKILRDVGE